MKNSQILEEILNKLEANHINLYHDISKKEVEKYISSIENIDELDSVEFDYELMKFFALFKDSHTSYYLKNILIDKEMILLNDNIYIFDDNEWKEVNNIAGLTTKELILKMKKIINYETKEWLNYKISKSLNNMYVYDMFKLLAKDGTLKVETITGQKIIVNKKEVANKEKKMPYSFKILENNILYFKYEACMENKSYTFNEFIKDLTKVIEQRNIKNYILDLRNNNGGDSEILNPFQDYVKNNNLKGVLLINNGVFSSARFAVARFKRDFNTLLIGEPTGGAIRSYGYNKPLNVGDKYFSVSIRLWDFSDIFGYLGAIIPDIYVPCTIEDLSKGKDIQLQKAIDEILKLQTLNKNY